MPRTMTDENAEGTGGKPGTSIQDTTSPPSPAAQAVGRDRACDPYRGRVSRAVTYAKAFRETPPALPTMELEDRPILIVGDSSTTRFPFNFTLSGQPL